MAGDPGHEPPAAPVSAAPEGAAAPAPLPQTEIQRLPAGWKPLVRLARPTQWAKGAFVLVGPLYARVDGEPVSWVAVAGAFLALGFASSAGYVLNDLRDAPADRMHPRKRRRPIASDEVSPSRAWRFALLLFALSTCSLGLTWVGAGGTATLWLGACVLAYAVNVWAYTLRLKHEVILDVMSLSMGFVIRVLAGCAAASVAPSTWLLNSTLFLAMFLAFGKRLGERRTLGDAADGARAVQSVYTDHLLRMMVVMSAVATLVTYAGYVQTRDDFAASGGFNLLWFTTIPATFALLRCIVLVEKGDFDDPTELATGDRPFQIAAVLFAALTLIAFAAGAEG